MIQVEFFRAFSFACPGCGMRLFYRVNQEETELPEHPRVLCQGCFYVTDRFAILGIRLAEEATEGISFICEACGRDNFTAGFAVECAFCREPVDRPAEC